MSLPFSLVSVVLFAFLLWSFTEYAMHRFNGHDQKGKTAFSRDHLAHHASISYMTPALDKAKRALVVSCFLFPLSMIALGFLHGVVFAIAYLVAYFFYDYLHLHCHRKAPSTAYGAWVRKHHFGHHFGHPKANFGVTTSLWDRVFGTYVVVERRV